MTMGRIRVLRSFLLTINQIVFISIFITISSSTSCPTTSNSVITVPGTSLANSAYLRCYTIISVTVPSTITFIGLNNYYSLSRLLPKWISNSNIIVIDNYYSI